jgi:hypothetical protein
MDQDVAQPAPAEPVPGLETSPTEIEQMGRDRALSRMAALIDAMVRDAARRNQERAAKFGSASEMAAGG